MSSVPAPARSREERSPSRTTGPRGPALFVRTRSRPAWARMLLAALVALAGASMPTEARPKRAAKAPPPASAQEETATAPEPEPFRPQVARLAEILGAVSYLDELCSKGQVDDWRASMQALLEAQSRTELEKSQMAGAFNRGYRGYRMTYRACTTNARSALLRFLDEGRRIARDVVDRYGSS